MRKAVLTMPVVAALAATRGMLGAGLALLLADHMTPRQKKIAGWGLFLTGATTTIPLALKVGEGLRKGVTQGRGVPEKTVFDFRWPEAAEEWQPVDEEQGGGRLS